MKVCLSVMMVENTASYFLSVNSGILDHWLLLGLALVIVYVGHSVHAHYQLITLLIASCR